MTTHHFPAIAAALLLSSMAVSAQAQSTAAPNAEPATQLAPAPAAKKGHDPNQVICKREQEIGSRLGGRSECHTRADWDEMARNASALMETQQMAGAHALNSMGH